MIIRINKINLIMKIMSKNKIIYKILRNNNIKLIKE